MRSKWQVLLLGLAWAASGGVAMAEVEGEVVRRRALSDDVIVWPPPNSAELVMDEARWGSPDAPFVFEGGVLHVGASFTSTRPFIVNEQAVINTHGDVALTLEGPVSAQPGSRQGLVKLGAGTLRLAGRNTYDGNTLLLQGGLDVLNGNALGAPYRTLNVNTGTRLRYAPGVVVGNSIQLQADAIAGQVPAGSYEVITPAWYADSVQWIVDGGEAVQAGAMVGSAPIVKQGGGLLRLAGPAVTYSGLFTVNQGVLAVDDGFWGPVHVNTDARLQGVGSVGAATIRSGGTLAPGNTPGNSGGPLALGNSVGTLAVRGDVVFEPGSRLEVDVLPSGASDLLHVGGRASLDGQVRVVAGAGEWGDRTRYTVLRAEGGLQGAFASADTNLAFLSPTLDYDAKQVYLTLTRNGTSFEDVAETPDKPVAGVVDDPAEVPGLHDQVLDLTAPQARDAFGQLSNSWAGSLRSMMLDDTRFLREAVWGNAGRGHGSGADDGVAKMWSQAFFSSSVRDGWHGVPGLGRDIGGVVLGVDGPTRSGWRVGGVFGAQDSHARGTSFGDRARVRTVQVGLTMAGRWRGIDVSGGAAHGWHAIDSRREVSAGALRDAPRAEYLAGSDQVFLEVSQAFALALARGGRGLVKAPPATTLAPFARLAWVTQRVRGFQEQGRDTALAVDGARQSLSFATVGVAVSHAVETAKGSAHVHARLGWRHAIGATRSHTSQRFVAGASGRRFTSEGLPVTRNAWQFDLAVRAKASRAVTLSLAYASQFARGATDHGFRLDGAWVF